MPNITNLICTKNKISYVIFNKEFQILDFSETFKSIVDDLPKLTINTDIRDVLWEIIGLENNLDNLYNNLLKSNTLHFPMILKTNDYYDLDIETFVTDSGEKLFIAYAMQKPKESLAYLNMVKEINKKTLIYETENKTSGEQNFDLINQKLLSFNVDMDGLITSVNNTFLLFFDKDKSEIMGKHFSTFFKARDFNINANATIIFNAKNVKNEIISFHANIIPLAKNEIVYENIILCQDITYLKQIEKELKLAASHDSLTGLPNRSQLLEKIDSSIKTAKKTKQGFSICFIDLNSFKPINETYGYHAGDMLLKHIAKILSDFVREDDLVARVGGDEFIIIFNAINDKKDIKKMEKRLLNLVPKHPLIYSEEDIIEFSFSLGIASFPQDANDILSLIQQAKKVMNRDKLQKKD
ncbi:diguanylate cyclase domain-containing protein [Sulfurimonas sp.]|uniref:diguanylate cyclase domain-containing protein n=1 Tax=Sulfurimonas sp. TaxID=2022749 RepID=UPI003D14DA4E